MVQQLLKNEVLIPDSINLLPKVEMWGVSEPTPLSDDPTHSEVQLCVNVGIQMYVRVVLPTSLAGSAKAHTNRAVRLGHRYNGIAIEAIAFSELVESDRGNPWVQAYL